MATRPLMRSIALLALPCLLVAWLARAEPAPASAPASEPTPPARPDAADADAKIRAVFDAIVHDDPVLAHSAFFPRDAFLLVKAMMDPGRYYDRLRKRFDQDIHALHAATPGMADARFERFELAKRGGYVNAGEEGNRLPYWASRHSFLHYRIGERALKLEVRVLITWESHWYVIHLSEFK